MNKSKMPERQFAILNYLNSVPEGTNHTAVYSNCRTFVDSPYIALVQLLKMQKYDFVDFRDSRWFITEKGRLLLT